MQKTRAKRAKGGADDAEARPRGDIIEGATGPWEVVIGMEVHAQVTSRAKLFSGASTAFGGPPNAHVSLVDAAMPGMLPVINAECVRQAVRTGLGLKAKINLTSVFARKNYFYPDLPQGYQISQYDQPIVGEGEVILDMKDGSTVRVGIERLHLEQDAGKSLHDQHPDYSYVDLNRSGVALMEIVSKPDLRSAEEARAYVTKLRTIMRYLGTCDGNMEQGSLRADINISVRRPGEPLGTRCEVKNVNSIRFIGQAIAYEAQRQVDILEDGGEIEQETRLFDPKSGKTRSMRSKEEAHDYRYFPDPDLLPLELDQAFVDALAAELPELPDEKKARFMSAYGLSAYDAGVLVASRRTADYFEAAVTAPMPLPTGGGEAPGKGKKEKKTGSKTGAKAGGKGKGKAKSAGAGGAKRDAKVVANWVMGDLSMHANAAGCAIADLGIAPERLAGLVDLMAAGTISGKIAKDVLQIMVEEGGDPAEIVKARGLEQMSDTGALEAIVEEIIAANPKQVEQVKTKPKTLGWFVGQVMKATQGKANPGLVNQLLRDRLEVGEG